jgi:hypothetical protein
VCPDCGEEAGSQPFCGSCGKNLSRVERLPTREEWETTRRAAPTANVGQDSPVVQRAASADSQPSGTRGVLSGRKWLAAAVGAAVVAVAVVLIVVLTSGGTISAAALEDQVADNWTIWEGEAEASCITQGRDEFSCDVTVRDKDDPNRIICQGTEYERAKGGSYETVRSEGLDLCYP